jgi:hypothetical protein
MNTNIPIADAMLFELKHCLILFGRTSAGDWFATGCLASIEFGKGTARDYDGCKYLAFWAGPEQELPADPVADTIKAEGWQRVFRYKANEWQRQHGWVPSISVTAAQAELWEIMVIGPTLRLAGLLSGHPQRRDGWGVTPPLSHLVLDSNFAVTAEDQQRWHLGKRMGGEPSRTFNDLLANVRRENPDEAEVFVLSQHELNEFGGKFYVSKR